MPFASAVFNQMPRKAYVYHMNIVIKNGLVYHGVDGFKKDDVAISSGMIAAQAPSRAALVIDAEGCLVAPGLIDYHTHVLCDSTEHGEYGDLCAIPNGVTTLVDAGTAGSATYEGFRKLAMQNSRANVFCYLNISPTGMVSLRIPENIDPALYDAEKVKALFKRYPGEIIGLKVRLPRKVLGNMDETPLLKTLKLGRELRCGTVVHVSESPISSARILELLGKGDVYCHCFTDLDCTILDDAGGIRRDVFKAREKGVVFDMANGSHFAIRVARAAFAQGFYPDIVSTDETFVSMYREPVFSLPYVMSKLLNLGMPLENVFHATTLAPARMLGREEELGTLRPGTPADIGIFKLTPHPVTFFDHSGDSLVGETIIKPLATIKDGNILYRQMDFLG
jgi:predicted amidohydrolase